MFHFCVKPVPRVLFCSLLGALPMLANAIDFSVTTTADEYDGSCDAHCSLRDAVSAANQAPGANRILLQAQTYLLTRAAPPGASGGALDEDGNLKGDLYVEGERSSPGLTGSVHSRISGQTNERLLEVLPGAVLNLDLLVMDGGATSYNGGAIENHGQLSLRRMVLEDNQAVTPDALIPVAEADRYRYGQGGAIANYGSLSIRDLYIQDNLAQGSSAGNQGRGGAIFNQGTVQVRNSTVRRNRVADQALTGAGGGLYNLGSADIARSAFLENYGLRDTRGGAIANEGGTLQMVNSTLSGHIRGGLSNGYPGNPVSDLAVAKLINVTIAGNAGGVHNWGELRIRNSLIAGNFDWDTGAAFNCENLGDTYRYEAIGLLLNDEPSNCTANVFVPFDQTYSVLMKSLFLDGDNGGPTKTYALLPGSPALDAAIGDCNNHDQRGFPRPVDGNGDGVAVCDLGAFELGAP